VHGGAKGVLQQHAHFQGKSHTRCLEAYVLLSPELSRLLSTQGSGEHAVQRESWDLCEYEHKDSGQGNAVTHMHLARMDRDASTNRSGSVPRVTATAAPTRWRIMLYMNDPPSISSLTHGTASGPTVVHMLEHLQRVQQLM
jgi:hypothetical protein